MPLKSRPGNGDKNTILFYECRLDFLELDLCKASDDTLRNFIFRTYLNNLAEHYNDEDDELLNLTEGNGLQQVQENKDSGYFHDYQSIAGEVLSIEKISENEYSVTVNRTFSHASSDGEQSTQVTYTVVDIDGMLKVSNFQ